MKRCSHCHTEKEPSAFCNDARTKDGLSSWCLQCHRQYNKARRVKNSAEIRRVCEGQELDPTQTKNCSKCQETKPHDQFNKKFTINGVRPTSRCRQCNMKTSAEHTKNNYSKKMQDNKDRYWRQRAWMDSLKDKPCMDCGKSYPPECMDFDHRDPTIKVERLSELSRKLASPVVILAEVAKCDLICANCHRIRTKKQLRALDNKWSNLAVQKVG